MKKLLNILKHLYSKREVLLKCGIAAYGGNYVRINRIMNNYGVSLMPSNIIKLPYEQLKRIETIHNKCSIVKEKKIFVKKQKINWPHTDVLVERASKSPLTKIAKELGISSGAIKKHLKKYGIDIKNISPWSKKHDPFQKSKETM